MNKRYPKIEKTVIRIKNSAIDYSKTHYILGSGKISIFDFFRFFWLGIRNESVGIRGSALAFKLFLSLFPAMIFLVTLLPYFSYAGSQEALLQTLESIMPEYSFKAFQGTITDILYKPRFGLLSIVFILSLFYSVSNMFSIINTFNKSYHFPDNRKFHKKLIISLILTLLFFAIIILSLSFIAFNEFALHWLKYNEIIGSWVHFIAIQYGRWPILFFIMLTWLSLFYTIVPPHNIKFRYFNPGSVFSSFFFILISLGLNFFVKHFLGYNQIFGALGVILVFFIWLYYSAIILLIGFEINASLFVAPDKKPEIDKVQLQ